MQVKTGFWYEPVQSMCGSIAGIVSNPPYIPHSQMRDLQAITLFSAACTVLVQTVVPNLSKTCSSLCDQMMMRHPSILLSRSATCRASVAHTNIASTLPKHILHKVEVIFCLELSNKGP